MPAPVALRAQRPEEEGSSTATLATALRRRRSDLGFCRGTAAKATSVHERTYRAWETGRSPEIEHWPNIIAFLGFEPWPNPETPAQKLKAARRRQGLSIQRAAVVLSVDPSTLWWWEHDRKPHLRAHRERIAAFIDDPETSAAPGGDVDAADASQADAQPIGEAIRRRRHELSLSQECAAEAVGVNTWTLLLWEQGRYAPTPRFYPGLIRFLDRDPWPSPRTLGERLRAERLRRGLTRRQLADLLQVDLGSISKWEAGRSPKHGVGISKVEAFLSGRPQPRRTARSRART